MAETDGRGFTVKIRGGGGLRLREYCCPEHGVFEALVPSDAGDELPCPADWARLGRVANIVGNVLTIVDMASMPNFHVGMRLYSSYLLTGSELRDGSVRVVAVDGYVGTITVDNRWGIQALCDWDWLFCRVPLSCGLQSPRCFTSAPAVHTQFVVSASQGKSDPRPHHRSMDVMPLGEGQKYSEWKKERKKVWDEVRKENLKKALE